MQILLSVRHGETPDSLKTYVHDQVEGLAKFFDRLVEADVHLDQEGHRHIAEIRIHSSNDTHFASTEAADWRSAVDGTVVKLRRQLKRHKEKLIRRKLTHEERESMFLAVQSRGPTITEESARVSDAAPPPQEWDRISSREAIARLEGSGEEVLVFVDTGDGSVKIARRSEAGSVSVVEAEAFEVEEG